MTVLPVVLPAVLALLATLAASPEKARSLGANDPSEKKPVGSRHQSAPQELRQLEFLLGAFDVAHVRRDGPKGDGAYTEGAFGTTYCLNGYALRHYEWDSDREVATAGFYVFDVAKKQWRLVRFRMPDYSEKVYYGSMLDGRLTLTETDRSGRERSRLTYESMGNDSFHREEQVFEDGGWVTLVSSEFGRISRGSMEHPESLKHGEAHPDAPEQLAEFAFMVGEFDTKEEIRNGDGSWRKSEATWNAAYFLSGFGIRDYYWNQKERFATANIRVYDPEANRWYVTFFSMPGNSFSSWEGGRVGDKMVMRPRGASGPNGSRLTFFNIDEGGYDWVSESVRGDTVTQSWREFATRSKG